MSPTAFPEVNFLLNLLLARVQAVLGDQFVGLYLYGSLASGDFDAQTSDIDFVVVTVDQLSAEQIAALALLHQEIHASDSKWATKLEGSYITQAALRRYVYDATAWPTLNEGNFYCAPHGYDWVIQRYILREQGVVVSGPPLRPLIDPVQPNELRQAITRLLQEWWQPMIENSSRLQSSEYQAYAILSMCRALHALQHATIVSKPAAAVWAQSVLGEKWQSIIADVLRWRPGTSLNYFNQAIELIQATVAQSKQC